jgi:hypothetical protein
VSIGLTLGTGIESHNSTSATWGNFTLHSKLTIMIATKIIWTLAAYIAALLAMIFS